MLGLYINIPYNKTISNYQNSDVLLDSDDYQVNKYVNHLILELRSYGSYFDRVKTIYIGGGVPTVLNLEQLERIFKWLTLIKPIEFNVEIEVDTFREEHAKLFNKYGVNRVVIKADTFNNKLLETLNRNYTKEQIVKTMKLLNEYNIKNINVDLKFGIPNQTLNQIKNDLKEIKKLKIPHISYYQLDIEEDSYFYNNNIEIDQDLAMSMFEYIIKDLKKHEYNHYEITHFAKNNQFSLHNTLYWTLEEYIGVGLGAHGFINNYRTINNDKIDDYFHNPLLEKEPQTTKDNIKNYLIFGLRLRRGINLVDFKNKYKVDILENYPKLNNLIDNNILEINNGNLRLTSNGIFYSNLVFEVFLWNIS